MVKLDQVSENNIHLPMRSRRIPDTKDPNTAPRGNIEATLLPSLSLRGSFTSTGDDQAIPIPQIK